MAYASPSSSEAELAAANEEEEEDVELLLALALSNAEHDAAPITSIAATRKSIVKPSGHAGIIAAAADTARLVTNKVSFERLRELAAAGDSNAAKIVNRFSTKRSWDEAAKLYDKVPPIRAQTVEDLSKFCDERTMSHVTSKKNWVDAGNSKRSSNVAKNIELEKATANHARGSADMTMMEKAGMRLGNAAPAIGRAAGVGAAVAGVVSGASHGYAWYKGEEEGKEALKSVAIDTVKGGFAAGALATASAFCPPIGTAFAVYSAVSLGYSVLSSVVPSFADMCTYSLATTEDVSEMAALCAACFESDAAYGSILPQPAAAGSSSASERSARTDTLQRLFHWKISALMACGNRFMTAKAPASGHIIGVVGLVEPSKRPGVFTLFAQGLSSASWPIIWDVQAFIRMFQLEATFTAVSAAADGGGTDSDEVTVYHPPEESCQLVLLAVRKRSRRLGVGAKMLQRLLAASVTGAHGSVSPAGSGNGAMAPASLVVTAHAQSAPGLAFFQKQGFEETARRHLEGFTSWTLQRTHPRAN